jgi:hypothetical protein
VAGWYSSQLAVADAVALRESSVQLDELRIMRL